MSDTPPQSEPPEPPERPGPHEPETPEPRPPEAPPDERMGLPVPVVLGFYGLMAALAVGIGWVFDVPSFFSRPPLYPELPGWVGPVAGVALGLGAHGLSEWASRFESIARFHARFAELLGPLRPGQVTAAAVASGFAEELLFRGVLLPLLGLWFSSLVFGAIHLAPGKEMRIWPVYAAVMGLALGFLYMATGSLLGPILAHFTVNWFGLSGLTKREA